MFLEKRVVFRSALFLGYILLPFMSLPVLPSDYRPLSVLFFSLTGSFILLSRIVKRDMPADELILLGFLLVSIFQTLAFVAVLNDEYIKAIRHIIVLAVGFLSYISLKLFFRIYGIDDAMKLMGKVYIFILAVGIIEILSIVHVLPWSFKSSINLLLSGRAVQRVQLVTSEASWAAKILLFAIPIYAFLLARYKNWWYLLGLILAGVLFCFTLSLDGFLAAGIAIIIFAIFKIRKILIRPKLFAAVVLAVAILVMAFYFTYRIFPKSGQYYLGRIETLKTMRLNEIKQLPETDASVFIRIYYPLIGLQMFLEKPYGVGLGGYSIYFKQFLDRIGIDYTRFPEVMEDIRTQTGDPKSLYAKILAENGLYSGWIIIIFFILQLYYLKRISADGIIYRNLVMGLLAVNLAVLFQFGSYAYLPLWFTLAMNETHSSMD